MLENQPKLMTSTDTSDLIIHLGYQVPTENNEMGSIKNKNQSKQESTVLVYRKDASLNCV